MTVSITGTIQDASGNPVPNAIVRLSPSSPSAGGVQVQDLR